jgi:glucosamine--fructose-6-phosphate aminotransferase (isomerizing)
MTSRLVTEAREAAAGARRQLERCASVFAELTARLLASPPPLVVTCARGSSDHAATYGKYVVETTVGHLVASVGPSVASMYKRAPVGLHGALVIVVSQSGRSPDLLELTAAARRGGALVVAFVNDETSPLAAACDLVVPLCAGGETAVAATKSFLLAGLAFVQLAAAWTGDPTLRDVAKALPEALEVACETAWDLSALAQARSLYVVGRGVGLGAAQEVALKLKETCRLHAEAFSTAEVLHGPVALVGPGFPVIALGQPDETEAAMRDVVAKLVAMGASVCTPPATTAPSVIAPLCHVQSFYLGLSSLAAARGFDPDTPQHLSKVTRTV